MTKPSKKNGKKSQKSVDMDNTKEKEFVEVTESEEARPPAGPKRVDSDSDDSSSDDDDDDENDDLVLEGVLIRNPEAPSSSDDDDDDDDEEEEETKSKMPPSSNSKKQKVAPATAKASKDQNEPPTKKAKASNSKAGVAATKNNKTNHKKKKTDPNEPEMVQVEFTFHDTNEKFFHGLKTLLHSSSTVYAPHSSELSDLMIENVSVGTVISTEGDQDGNVYGFASILNVTTYQHKKSIQHLKEYCLKTCPAQHKPELEVVLSGKTKRPAGFLLQSRMINLPLEIVNVLHQQLVLDIDWAVKNAEGGEAERKSLDFGAFVRLAPAYNTKATPYYKYFDDEIFANNAEFCYTVDAPTMFGSETKQLCSIIVMTKTGHRDAMEEMKQLISGKPSR